MLPQLSRSLQCSLRVRYGAESLLLPAVFFYLNRFFVCNSEICFLFLASSEPLPLGSLLWLVSIICSFLLPVLGDQNLKNTKGQGRGDCHEIVMNGGVKDTILEKKLGSGLGNYGRRYRGTRSRIKRFDLLHVVEVL